MIEVHKPGSIVRAGKIAVLITELSISSQMQVRYKCVWWNGSSRYSEWFSELEINGEAPSLRVGFGEAS